MKTAFLSIPIFTVLLVSISFGQDNPRHILPAPGIDTIVTLEQNWSDEESNTFYNMPQGSRLLPYELFIHLEKADSEQLFASPEHIRELGYIARAPSADNPDGLPIGFVEDAPYSEEIRGLGLTCAACHTGQIVNGSRVYIIDGAPTMGDFELFLRRLVDAIENTAADDAKFERFAAKVLPEGSSLQLKHRLREFIRTIAEERAVYNQRNLPASDQLRFGHGRVDAFGAIFNQVSTEFLGIPENAQPADAPVSYPCLWDAPQHDRVQWNGAAENRTNPLGEFLFGTAHVGALGRNAGEVLGVFGHVDIEEFELLLPNRYESSVNKENLIALENSLMTLWSPEWPFEPVEGEAEMRLRGAEVYQNNCVQCHALIDRDAPERSVTAHLANVGTDMKMIENFGRTARTGVLEGRRKTLLGFERFQSREPVGVMLKHVVERAILQPLSLEQIQAMVTGSELEDLDSLNPGFMNTAIITVEGQEYRIQIDQLIQNEEVIEIVSSRTNLIELAQGLRGAGNELPRFESLSSADESLGQLFQLTQSTDEAPAQAAVPGASAAFGYKARPLNGIWATAPYLHNGSVPNLTELLKAPADRVSEFHVGSVEYDIDNVGFISDPAFPVFDTEVPGNSNDGHDFGSELTPQQKLDLIAYLKSL